MNCIDWYAEKTQRKIIKKDIKLCGGHEAGNEYVWKDLISCTWYFIDRQIFERIYSNGCNKLCMFYADGSFGEIERMFYGKFEDPDTDLFAQLPFLIDQTDTCARLGDYACIRTGILYALKYDELRKREDFSSAKQQLRFQGLIGKFVDVKPQMPELEWIDVLLQNRAEAETLDISRHGVDIVKGGMIKIKQYYMETGAIPEIRGASRLLDKVNYERMPECICEDHIRECLIYTGGGKLLGIFPENCGENMCRRLERLVEECTVTAQSNFCTYNSTMLDFVWDYKGVTEKMELLLEERQNLRWDFRIEPNVPYFELSDEMNAKYDELTDNKEVLCESCRHRAAVFRLKADLHTSRCQSCLYKRLNGDRFAKKSIFEQYCAYIRHRYDVTIDKGKTYDMLSEIGEMSDGFIGVIYGDANSMSAAIERIQSTMEMRYFSEVTKDAVTEIVFEALYRHLKTTPAFEIIAMGGDDIFIIVPGKYAYGIALTLGELFDKQFKDHTKNTFNMTMSVGVCITHYKLPLQFSSEFAMKLLKSAKKMAWREAQKGKATGTIDWMVIENETYGEFDISRESNGKPHRTMRPYTWRQARAMVQFVNNLREQKLKSFAFQMSQSWYQHMPPESELFYQYQISRLADNRSGKAKKAQIELAIDFNGRSEKNYIKLQDKKYVPWIDAIELWDYAEESTDV